ncbi:hypothetical protein [Dongia sp.]|uniref:hypothetical protein n=1 Tax=Dongia sp. TaxID=1977262 RepID=UPI0035B2B758
MLSDDAPQRASLGANTDQNSPAMNPILARIAAYLSKRRDGTAVDPVHIAPDLLPHLFILAIERDHPDNPPRLRIRLTGTTLDNAFGRSVKGHFMEEFLHGTHSAAVLAGFRSCVEPGTGIWMRQVVKIGNRAPRFVEGVAVHVEPNRIYGGLQFGELVGHSTGSSFESRRI